MNSGYRYRTRLGAEASGRSVLSYLAERYPHSSHDVWSQRIASGRVSLNGVPVGASTPLTSGALLVWDRPPWVEPASPSSFAVLYRDDDILAVAKPRGMAAMPGGGFLERTLLKRVGAFDALAAPLHRLGRGTSGITLFTRNKASRRRLAQSWSSGAVERNYVGLVRGLPPWNETVAGFPIGPVPHGRLESVHAASASGKRAESLVRLVETRASTSLVEITIETGRTHQIRIHLAALGYPLDGDPLYPSGGVPDPGASVLPGELGYHLHAHSLRFLHPSTGRRLTLTCSPPPILRRQS